MGHRKPGGKRPFPIQILRRYYGNNFELVTTNDIRAIPSSYPGTPLRLGSTGNNVSIIQRQLNRIAKTIRPSASSRWTAYSAQRHSRPCARSRRYSI